MIPITISILIMFGIAYADHRRTIKEHGPERCSPGTCDLCDIDLDDQQTVNGEIK